MSDQSAILKEYLVALGFVVNDASVKKADDAMDKFQKRSLNVAKAVLGVAAATKAMVAVFAFQMEKLYYASQRADSSAGKLKQMDYAWRSLGGSGEQMTSMIQGLASTLRSNPGFIALIENLGVPTQGRDMSDVAKDLLDTISKMPRFIGAQYANMFGIPEDMLHVYALNKKEFEEAQRTRDQMARDSGVDMEKAAKAGKEYAQTLRELAERMGLLKDALAIALLPSFQEFARSLNQALGDLTRMVSMATSAEDFFRRIGSWITTGNPNGAVTLTPESRARLNAMGVEEPKAGTWIGRLWQKAKGLPSRGFGSAPGASGTSTPAPTPPKTNAPAAGASLEERQAYLASLEQKYGLPPGWLDRVWHKESSRGKNMLSPAGAMGHFQFMPKTAQEYGLKDPNNFQESANASALYFSRLFKRFDNDPAKAAAAYNWGQGRVARLGLDKMPKETRDYVDAVAGPAIEYNISISGVSDPAKAAQFADSAVRRSTGEIVRDLKTGVR